MISAIYIVPTIFFKYLNNFSWMDGMARLVDGRMPAAAKGSLLPRQCLDYSDVAECRCQL